MKSVPWQTFPFASLDAATEAPAKSKRCRQNKKERWAQVPGLVSVPSPMSPVPCPLSTVLVHCPRPWSRVLFCLSRRFECPLDGAESTCLDLYFGLLRSEEPAKVPGNQKQIMSATICRGNADRDGIGMGLGVGTLGVGMPPYRPLINVYGPS